MNHRPTNPRRAARFSPARRRLLQSACATASAGAIGAALSSLRMTQLVTAAQGDAADYRGLVCLFMFGGNDSANLIIPNGAGPASDNSSYAAYHQIRGHLAVPQSELLPIANPGGDGRAFAMPSFTPELAQRYAAGELALIANIGSLVAPISLQDYYGGGEALRPYQLFSHKEQLEQWQSSLAQNVDKGWGGRLADYIHHLNGNSQMSMSVSLGGVNLFEVGSSVFQYGITPEGAVLEGFDGSPRSEIRRQALGNLMGRRRDHLLEQAYADTMNRAVDQHALLTSVLDTRPPLQTTFPDTTLGRQLQMIARMIGAREEFGLRRQIFFCSKPGFDTHETQENQPELLGDVSQCIAAFNDAMTELSAADEVTLFTASDFGRTTESNGKGSDHGWGGHHVVTGGAVRGGQIYGRMPVMEIEGPDDVGRGRWLPSTAVDELAATLARWFGVPDRDLELVVPNLGRFANRDLGFMG